MEVSLSEKIRGADRISSNILTLYTKKASSMHFRFGTKCISLKDFFRLLLPSISSTAWPVDPEEIGRVWHDLIVMKEEITGFSLEIALPKKNTIRAAEEVLLNPEGMHMAIYNDPLRPAQGRPKILVDPATGFLRRPISEVQLTTFKRCWFLSSTVYLKRFVVPEEAQATTLLITRTPRFFGGTRYTLTWFPHLHCNAHVIQTRGGVEWHTVATPTTEIWKSGSKTEPSAGQMKVLAWNVMGTVNMRFGKAFSELVRHEKPSVVILVGAASFGHTARRVISNMGFCEMVHLDSDPGLGNSFCVVWSPEMVEVQSFPFYNNGLFLRLKVLQSGSGPQQGVDAAKP